MANRPMSKPITPLRGLTPTLFSCPRPLPGPRPGSLPVCRATAWRPNGFPGARVRLSRSAAWWGPADAVTAALRASPAASWWGSAWAGASGWAGASVGGRVGSSGPGSAWGWSPWGRSAWGCPPPGAATGSRRWVPAVGAGTGDHTPAVPGTEVSGGVVVGRGDGGTLGTVVDRTGTVTPGPGVGDAPLVPIRVVGTPTDAGAGERGRLGGVGRSPDHHGQEGDSDQPPTCDAERLEGVARSARPFSGTVARGPCSHGRTLDPPGGCVSGAGASSPGRAAHAPTDARNDASRRRPRHILRRSARPGAPVRRPVPTPRPGRPRPPAWRSSRRW